MNKKLRSKKKVLVPRMPWQIGDFSRVGVYQFVLPYEFLLLCRLMDVAPRTMLMDFMLSITSPKGGEHNEQCRLHTLSFIQQKYGRKQFTAEQLKIMFGELERSMLPDLPDADDALLEAHEIWKSHFLHHWFGKWSKVSASRTPSRLPS